MKKLTKAEQFRADMKRLRGVEFMRLGMQIEVEGEIGTIVGMNSSANLNVRFANQQAYGKAPVNCHPFWETRYFDAAGCVIADYREHKPVAPEPLPNPSSAHDALANDLAIAAPREAGVEELEVSATLSVDRPASLRNFEVFRHMLLQAYLKGRAAQEQLA